MMLLMTLVMVVVADDICIYLLYGCEMGPLGMLR